MRWFNLPLIVLLGACAVLALVLVFSSMIPVMGSPPVTAGQPPSETPAVPPAPVTSSARVTPTNLEPSPLQTTTAVPLPAPAEPLPSPSPTAATISATKNPYTISTTALEERVHELITQQRTARGLASLRVDPALAAIARTHSEDMAVQQYFAHVNPEGQNPTARGTAAGYSCRKTYGSYYTYGIAENLFLNNLYSSATFYSNRETVYDWNSPEEIAQTTVFGWMNSSGHRENILTPTFDREGIGVAIGLDDKVYITEDFC
jgi:uncharacterized protein YkwD